MSKQLRSWENASRKKTEQQAKRLRRAEGILGYTFEDKRLLRLALTHPSASEGNSAEHSYERLEFLGDAILGAIISHELYKSFPYLNEGALTRLKVSVVAGQTLSKVSDELGLGELIIFGSSERGTGKRGLQSALENVYEALVAALALDGGITAATHFVVRTLIPMINTDVVCEPENPKSLLQEMLQTQRVTPKYEIIATEGPPHDRLFTARVLADERMLAEGSGPSKKDAEMAAAQKALDTLKAQDAQPDTEEKR